MINRPPPCSGKTAMRCGQFIVRLFLATLAMINRGTRAEQPKRPAGGDQPGEVNLYRISEDALAACAPALHQAEGFHVYRILAKHERQRCERGQAALQVLKRLDRRGGPALELLRIAFTQKNLPSAKIHFNGQRMRRPSWLREAFGDNEFELVQRIGCGQIDDAMLADIGAMTGLEEVDLYGGDFTDVGLSRLVHLDRLRRLHISSENITDKGLGKLGVIRSLKELSVFATHVTGSGFRSFSRLESLDITDAPITDAGLSTICEIEGLRELRLTHTQITDAGLAHLIKSPQLTRLDLVQGHITDAGAAHLSSLKQLESLSLSFLKITDASLK
ncbi:MAG TPA: hypothetical protein VFW87_05360, partial [Pirellulales bacterium]|nr:hypothetical protein [Pirellulales bacterium]